jgi:anhydro-N-acetylmuramic acid kinase
VSAPARDPLLALAALRELRARRVVGLLSGTSADGTDAAVVEIAGSGETTRASVLSFHTRPFPEALRRRTLAAGSASAAEICTLNVLLAEEFARAALDAIEHAGLTPGDVHLIGSHGQTVCHQPRSAGQIGATLQLGEPAVIAERTGLPVVSGFRTRDMAAGGEGAPLVPLVDALLFRPQRGGRALQNIGGIANVTVLTHEGPPVAFDNGPGNMALDAVARVASRGQDGFDRNGARAARGTIDEPLLAELGGHPFLDLPPPRSTGREQFGPHFVAPLLGRFRGREDDLIATLTLFSAQAIAWSYERFVFPSTSVDEIYVSGGGVHNQTLMGHLERLMAPRKVASLTALGIDPDAKEAIAFAVLANETLHGRPGNVPTVTGAGGPRVLGTVTL